MAVVILAMTAVLLGELARRAFQAGGDGEITALTPVSLPAGARVETITYADPWIVVHARLVDGSDRLFLLDPQTGTVRDWPLGAPDR